MAPKRRTDLPLRRAVNRLVLQLADGSFARKECEQAPCPCRELADVVCPSCNKLVCYGHSAPSLDSSTERICHTCTELERWTGRGHRGIAAEQRLEFYQRAEVATMLNQSEIEQRARLRRLTRRSAIGPPDPAGVSAVVETHQRAQGRKRPTTKLAELASQIALYVHAHPGCRIGDIAQRLDMSVEALALPLQKLLSSGAVHSTGCRRATRYYPSRL
jgi:hypothetical protein